jgi:hypothetical protein
MVISVEDFDLCGEQSSSCALGAACFYSDNASTFHEGFAPVGAAHSDFGFRAWDRNLGAFGWIFGAGTKAGDRSVAGLSIHL